MIQGGRAWTLRLLTVALSVAVALLLAEAGLRIAAWWEPTPVAQDHGQTWEWAADLHHRLLPNVRWRHRSQEFDYLWQTNALGMRDRPHELRKARGSYRILLLGDSFLQGHGVPLEATFGTLLDSSLNHPAHSQPVEVMNAAVFGYSPFVERLQLAGRIDSLEPDLVLLGFFLGNDVGEDAFYSQRAHPDSSGQVRFSDREWPWSAMLSLLDHDSLLRPASGADHPAPSRGVLGSLRHAIGSTRLVGLVQAALARPVEEPPGPIPIDSAYRSRREREHSLLQQHLGDIRYNTGLVNFEVLDRERRMAYWAPTLTALTGIAELCRTHHARLVVVVIPPIERLRRETQFAEPYQVLDRFGREQQIPVVNLLPDFLGGDPDSLYYRYDHHWTVAGHRRASAVVAEALSHLNLLPPVRP